ncbi:MAG: beta-N-acetylhexosaminidase [Desulfomonilaceae bacterium]|nr:beta-N-acetylhexosaminidase [Desulfomonilaceae bacterium]
MDPAEIGSLFMVGFSGTSFSAELRDLMDDLNPCGVILFSRNIEHPVQTAELTHALQRHALRKHSQGLFIGVDQEGGRVRRLTDPFRPFPPALSLARTADPEDTVREFARVTSHEIRLAGFNLDFVPVLDVLGQRDNPESSVIGDRSYGFDPHTVSRLGNIVTDVMRAGGVIPCGKHFPGHGGTTVDSHVDLPVDERPVESLEQLDLIPFRSAVANNVEMLMTAHILYRAIDPVYPATLSHKIVTGILRQSMLYNGLVITDDLDMGAVAKRFSTEDCALMAVRAGVDVLLICRSPEKALAARDELVRAVKTREVSESGIQGSLSRIHSLKTAYKGSLKPADPADVRDYFGI